MTRGAAGSGREQYEDIARLPDRADAVVVGAGLAGLVAAGDLAAAGMTPLVVEADSEVGGRLATVELGDHTVAQRADTGAQFFTVRDGSFAARVDRWRAADTGIVEWCRGFLHAGDLADGPRAASAATDGHPRYAVAGGVAVLAGGLADNCAKQVSPAPAVTLHAGPEASRELSERPDAEVAERLLTAASPCGNASPPWGTNPRWP